MINWEEKRKALDFFLDKAEKGETATSGSIDLLKLVADTDKLPRIIWDRETRVIYANKSFLDKTGYTFEQVKDKPFFNEDGTSPFITDDTLEISKKVVIENASNGVEMVNGVRNKWKSPNGKDPIAIDWHKGFNDTQSQLGSVQCTIVTWNKKGEALCTICNQVVNG